MIPHTKLIVPRWAAVTTAGAMAVLLTAAMAHASEAAGYTTVSETVESSSVAGSSPTSLGASKLALTDPAGYTTSSETVVSYDAKTGKVLSRQHFGAKSEGKIIHPYPSRRVLNDHGTGGTSSASGCNKVTISMTRHTFSGTFAARFKLWTDWCWTRSNETVRVNSYGRDDDLAPGYHYNGLAYPPIHYYYDFSTNNGFPRSAYFHKEEGLFSGPTGTFAGGSWDPQITLSSYYNGTNQWWTSD